MLHMKIRHSTSSVQRYRRRPVDWNSPSIGDIPKSSLDISISFSVCFPLSLFLFTIGVSMAVGINADSPISSIWNCLSCRQDRNTKQRREVERGRSREDVVDVEKSQESFYRQVRAYGRHNQGGHRTGPFGFHAPAHLTRTRSIHRPIGWVRTGLRFFESKNISHAFHNF